MKHTILILLSFALFTPIFGQVTGTFSCKSKNVRDIKIVSISIYSTSTTIEFEYINTRYNDFTIFLGAPNTPNAYYIKANDKIYNLKSTNGIANKEGITSAYRNKALNFSATFEPLPKSVNEFNLIEGNSTGGIESWDFIGIKLSVNNNSIDSTSNNQNSKSYTYIKYLPSSLNSPIIVKKELPKGPTIEECFEWLRQNVNYSYSKGNINKSTSFEIDGTNYNFIKIIFKSSDNSSDETSIYEFKLADIELFELSMDKSINVLLLKFHAKGDKYLFTETQHYNYYGVWADDESSTEIIKHSWVSIPINKFTSESDMVLFANKALKVFNRISEITNSNPQNTIDDNWFNK